MNSRNRLLKMLEEEIPQSLDTQLPLRRGVVFRIEGFSAHYVAIERDRNGWIGFKVSFLGALAGPHHLVIAECEEDRDHAPFVIHGDLPLYFSDESLSTGWMEIEARHIDNAVAVHRAWLADEWPSIDGITGRPLVGDRMDAWAKHKAEHESVRQHLQDQRAETRVLWGSVPYKATALLASVRALGTLIFQLPFGLEPQPAGAAEADPWPEDPTRHVGTSVFNDGEVTVRLAALESEPDAERRDAFLCLAVELHPDAKGHLDQAGDVSVLDAAGEARAIAVRLCQPLLWVGRLPSAGAFRVLLAEPKRGIDFSVAEPE